MSYSTLRKAIADGLPSFQIDKTIANILLQEKEASWYALKFKEHADTLPLTEEEYLEANPTGDYAAYLIQFGPVIDYDDWLDNKHKALDIDYKTYVKSFGAPISRDQYLMYGLAETKRPEVVAAEAEYITYLQGFQPMGVADFTANNPELPVARIMIHYRLYLDGLPVPRSFADFFTLDVDGFVKPEIQTIYSEWEVYRDSVSKPLAKADWISMEGRDIYLYDPTPVTDQEIIDFKITNSDIFTNFAINPLATTDPLAFAKEVRIQELKDDIRKDLGYEIGDSMDNMTDVIRQALLGYCISAGIETDPTVIASFNTYCEQMLMGYGGGAAIMQILANSAQSFQAHIVNRFYTAKAEVDACTDIKCVKQVRLPKKI